MSFSRAGDSIIMMAKGGSPLFDLFTKEPRLREILACCPEQAAQRAKVTKAQSGKTIFRQGEPPPFFCILLAGHLRAYYTSSFGTRYRVLIHNPGEIMGEIEILEGRSCICTVEALKESTLLCLNKEDYLQWLQADRNFNMYIHRQLCDKVYLMAKKSAEDILYPLKYRLLNLVHYLLEENDWADGAGVPMRKETLEEELGVTVRSINRIIRELKTQGVLCYERGYLKVLSRQLLIREMNQF
jgi:CRP-like cAMP-binding protein